VSILTRFAALEVYRCQFQVRLGRWRAYRDTHSGWIVGTLANLQGEPSVPEGFLTIAL